VIIEKILIVLSFFAVPAEPFDVDVKMPIPTKGKTNERARHAAAPQNSAGEKILLY